MQAETMSSYAAKARICLGSFLIAMGIGVAEYPAMISASKQYPLVVQSLPSNNQAADEGLKILVLVDPYFKQLVAARAVNLPKDSTQDPLNTISGNRSDLDKLVSGRIYDEVSAASRIFERNASLEALMGKKISLRIIGFEQWVFDKNKYEIGGMYDAGKLVYDIKENYSGRSADLVLAFTGLPLAYRLHPFFALNEVESCKGLASNIGERFSIIGPDSLTTPLLKGSFTAHEIGHNLGLRHSKETNRLMSVDPTGKSDFFDIGEARAIAKHLRSKYPNRF